MGCAVEVGGAMGWSVQIKDTHTLLPDHGHYPSLQFGRTLPLEAA